MSDDATEQAAQEMEEVLREPSGGWFGDLQPATGRQLDTLGSTFGMHRNPGETDTSFRERLLRLLHTSNFSTRK